jgi:predicted dehydrogenase
MGVAGLGGYAGSIVSLLETCAREAEPSVTLAAVTDPEPQRFAAKIEELRGRGVRFVPSYQELLSDRQVEAVWLPLPIHLHLAFTEKALAAGKAVMCEKPAAGCVQDVDQMIALRDRSQLPVAIGFQHHCDPAIGRLKKRLLAGAIGTVGRGVLLGCWGRNEDYFGRAGWAGRLAVDGIWVLDSPANNALAHYINLALFLLGPSAEESARVVSVEAELYRANPIENYDTCALRIAVEGGAELLVLLTHACQKDTNPVLTITGAGGRARWCADEPTIRIEPSGKSATAPAGARGLSPSRPPPPAPPELIERAKDPRVPMVQRFARLVRGTPGVAVEGERPATLEQARAHALVVSAASQAAEVVDVPADAVDTMQVRGVARRIIRGIEEALTRCAAEGMMPNESGLLPWTRRAGRCATRNYHRFEGPKGR